MRKDIGGQHINLFLEPQLAGRLDSTA
jgi:hypothetical protein